MFFDSSALFAGVVSATGAARALLMMAEAGTLAIAVSEQVIAEAERALAREAPLALDDLRAALHHARVRIVRDPAPAKVAVRAAVIAHAADVPIVVAAMQARVDYLVTLNRRHFVDDPGVAARSGLRFGLPKDALSWVLAVVPRAARGKELGARSPDAA
jgi:predicted nucleic acid-binding protein